MATNPPRIHALLIGIDAYALPGNRLSGCVNDIEAFEAMLRAQAQASAADCSILKLTAKLGGQVDDRWPTRQRIVSALESLAGESVQLGDRVLIYYAGHGVRMYFPKTGSDFEALVPSDFLGQKSQLLFDFEVGKLLAAIAARSRDLTVFLDCCQSGGMTRDLDDKASVKPRFLAVDTDVTEEPPSVPSGGFRSLAGTEPSSGAPYCVIAACQDNESAVELDLPGPQGTGQMCGLLTYALLKVLSPPLAELRWAEVWEPLRAEMYRLYPKQHPVLLGPAWHRVLGGSSERFDPGLSSSPPDGDLSVIHAGVLAGLDTDAVLAVYGPREPAFFPPLDTAEDLAARLGTLRVVRSDLTRAWVEPIAPPSSDWPFPPSARVRLVQLSPHRQLAVYCEPEVATEDRTLLQSLSRTCLLVGSRQEAELLIGQGPAGELLLGDRVFCHLPNPEPGFPGPLARIPPASWQISGEDRRAAITAAVSHYALKYVVPLRLSLMSGTPWLRAALDLSVVDCSDSAVVADLQTGDGTIKKIRIGKDGACEVQQGALICFHVHNMSTTNLYVTLLTCNTDGAVDLMAEPVHLKALKGALFWHYEANEPTPFAVSAGQRTLAVERLIAVGCTSPDVNIKLLARSPDLGEPESLQALIDGIFSRDPRGELPPRPPSPAWTATSLLLKITK